MTPQNPHPEADPKRAMSEQQRFELRDLLRRHADAAYNRRAFEAGALGQDIVTWVNDLLEAPHA